MTIRSRNAAVWLVGIALCGHVLAAQGAWPTAGWPSASPASLGFDAKLLAAFDAEIAGGKYGYIDGMLVIRHGKIAYERAYPHDYGQIYGKEARTTSALNAHDPSGPYNYFNPWWHPFYRGGDLHTMQSVTKTVTSVVIGIAIARHEFPSIDTPVLSFFDAGKVANVDDRKRRMTIKHVLTMTAGLDWNEDLPYADPKNTGSVMEAAFDWVQYTIDRPMAQEPGTVFRYNSGATQILSQVFQRATGKDIEEYAAQHLFAPLGITRFYWKRTPTGLADTEGGLYLTARDLAKIAYLYLKDGVWDGKPVVTSAWVKDSISLSITVSEASGVKYGYKWWLYPYGKEGRIAFGGSGFGGQRPLVLPELDTILVFTGWNILPGQPGISTRAAIERVVDALVDRAR